MRLSRLIAATMLSTTLCTGALAQTNQAPPVGVVTGMLKGTYAATGADLTSLDSSNLRVVVMLGRGSLQNLDDLLHLRGVDVAFCQADALAYIQQHNLWPTERNKIEYVAKLYSEEVHVVARTGINIMSDLTGRKINVDVDGSGSAMTAGIVLQALGITAEVSHLPQETAIGMLEQGQLDAAIHVGGAPIPLFAHIPPNTGLHFVPLPFTSAFNTYYLPDQISSEQYPTLIQSGTSIPTVSVPDVMAVYAWPQSSARYTNLAQFTDALFAHITALQQPPHHPKWREVNLAATVPGWARFPEMQADIDALKQQRDMSAFLSAKGLPASAADKLFAQFLLWERARNVRP